MPQPKTLHRARLHAHLLSEACGTRAMHCVCAWIVTAIITSDHCNYISLCQTSSVNTDTSLSLVPHVTVTLSSDRAMYEMHIFRQVVIKYCRVVFLVNHFSHIPSASIFKLVPLLA